MVSARKCWRASAPRAVGACSKNVGWRFGPRLRIESPLSPGMPSLSRMTIARPARDKHLRCDSTACNKTASASQQALVSPSRCRTSGGVIHKSFIETTHDDRAVTVTIHKRFTEISPFTGADRSPIVSVFVLLHKRFTEHAQARRNVRFFTPLFLATDRARADHRRAAGSPRRRCP